MSSSLAVRQDAAGDHLSQLLRSDTPFIDLRAPVEFAAGAVPGAVNLPLLSDDERHQIGVTYKREGNAAAVALGERLVSGPVRAERLAGWQAFLSAHPDAWIYCWRGGQRSQIVQDWLQDEGLRVERVPGGFKALRQHCLAVLERTAGDKRWVVLGGRTGSGKTELLKQSPLAIDLEGRANHRGSAFGGRDGGQPPPVSFENQLAVDALKHSSGVLLVEDESRTIGRLALPAAWHAAMGQAELLILEVPLAERVANIEAEYVTAPLREGTRPEVLKDRLRDALDRIRRRLGGARHAEVAGALDTAFTGGAHGEWIERLLRWYYDPMYDYQLERKGARVIARGDGPALLATAERLNAQVTQAC